MNMFDACNKMQRLNRVLEQEGIIIEEVRPASFRGQCITVRKNAQYRYITLQFLEMEDEEILEEIEYAF